MKRLLFFIVLFLFVDNISASPKRKLLAGTPFELVGSYVVVKAGINDSPPLNFILDTGVRNTLITELTESDSISLNYVEEREMLGLGYGKSLKAFVSNDNFLSVGKLKIPDRTVLVLQEDIFNLSRQLGMKINGLLGFDFFENYIVEINYTNRRIRLYEQDTFIAPQSYKAVPIHIEAQKMFVDLSVSDSYNGHRKVKMLIDTGAKLNAWFQTFTKELVEIPEKNIFGRVGEGLSGEVSGKLGRISQLCIADFCFKNMTAAFPDSASIGRVILNSDRDGTIGSKVLSRFNMYVDVKKAMLYVKPNAYYKKPFTYNVAGMEIVQTILYVPQFEIINVWKDSPAEQAGIKSGDIILEINREKIFSLTLSQVREMLERPSRRPLKILLKREDKKLEMKINMQAKI